MIEIIPAKCLSILPFKSEALSSWSHDSELLKYLTTLFNKEGEFSLDDGRNIPVNFSSFGKDVYDKGIEQFQTISKEFHIHAGEAETIPEFFNDTNFGLMAKYSVAWSGTVNEVLSEGAFFSLAHILESQSELECSVLLASHQYYKQALQILRNFLEGIVVELFFCDNQADFASWKANALRFPSFRGKNGMLDKLLKRGLLSPELVDIGSDLYGDLNGSIHGSESRLNHAGIFTGEFFNRAAFEYQTFATWTSYFSRCVDFGIQVQKTNLDLWQKLSSAVQSGIQCNVCHKSNDFDIAEKREFAGVELTTLKCRQCGNSMAFNSEFLNTTGLG